jgi:site-specific recombinase XerD
MTDFFKTVRGYILEYLPKQRCLSENTITSYKAGLNLLIGYLRNEKQFTVGQINFTIFDQQLILDYLQWLENKRKCSVSSRNQRLMVLRSFFEYAGTVDGTQTALQLEVSKIPRKSGRVKMVEYLSETALQTLLVQPDTAKETGIRDQFFMTLMYDTAARCGELLNLHVRDIRLNLKYPEAHLIGKGSKPRAVALLGRTCELCKRYMQIYHKNPNPDDYLFYTVIHGIRHQMSADAVAAFMKKYGKSARAACPEVPERVHPHQLRHTRAIHYYRGGMPLALVAEQLGHASAETTKIYAYADSNMKRTAIEKIEQSKGTPTIIPVWESNEEMILQLVGLK